MQTEHVLQAAEVFNVAVLVDVSKIPGIKPAVGI